MMMMMMVLTTTIIMKKMMMMMMMIMMMMIIIAFLQPHHCATNCLQHVRSSGHGAIECKSRATHRAHIMCNMSWYEGTAQLLNLTKSKSDSF